jgi:hypothetical protein
MARSLTVLILLVLGACGQRETECQRLGRHVGGLFEERQGEGPGVKDMARGLGKMTAHACVAERWTAGTIECLMAQRNADGLAMCVEVAEREGAPRQE